MLEAAIRHGRGDDGTAAVYSQNVPGGYGQPRDGLSGGDCGHDIPLFGPNLIFGLYPESIRMEFVCYGDETLALYAREWSRTGKSVSGRAGDEVPCSAAVRFCVSGGRGAVRRQWR